MTFDATRRRALGQILLLAGWRAIFWAQAIFGAFALAGLLLLPETLPPERRARRRCETPAAVSAPGPTGD